MMNSLILEPLEFLIQRFFVAHYGGVYLQGDHPWTKDSLGLIYITDGYGEDRLEDLYPEFLEKNYLQKAASLEEAQDSITNGLSQKKNVTLEELVACFNFHSVYEGFLDLLNHCCRICGKSQGNPIRDEDEIPSWEVCECCGSRAGIDDCDIDEIRIRRKAWLDGGAKWLFTGYKPLYRTPEEEQASIKLQLQDIPPEWL